MSLCCFVYKSKTTSTAILSFKKSFLFGSAFPRLESPVLPWKDENDNEKIAPVPGPRSQGRVVENPGKDQQSDQHHQWGRQNACVWHTWQGYHLGVLSWSSLNISVFWSFTKNLFKARWSLAESFFKQSYCHACHTRFAVGFPFPSCCVLKLTILNYRLSIHLRILWFYILSLLLCVSNRNLPKSLHVSRFALSKILSCFSAFDTKSWPSSAHGDAYPCYAYTECRACAVSGFAISLCIDPVLKMRARKVSWLWYTLRTSLGARRRTREKKNFWNPGTGRRCLGSRTYNGLCRRVSRRFWLAFPVSFQAFSVNAFNPKRIGRA